MAVMRRGRIDRSTGGSARCFVLLAAVLLAAACSSLKLGYSHADTLLLHSLNRYFDLDDRQQELARERVRGLLDWHRRTQLADYAQLFTEAERTLNGRVSADDVTALQRQTYARLATIGEQAAPDLAALAVTLSPPQIERFADRLARDASKERRELARFADGRESVEERVERYTERAETWFGSVNDEQAQILRAAAAARSDTWWLEERDRRRRELVQLLQSIHEDRPPAAEATRRIRDHFASLAEPREAGRRAAVAEYRRANAELIARMINAATPEQRAVLTGKLRGYAEDFTALASAR